MNRRTNRNKGPIADLQLCQVDMEDEEFTQNLSTCSDFFFEVGGS